MIAHEYEYFSWINCDVSLLEYMLYGFGNFQSFDTEK